MPMQGILPVNCKEMGIACEANTYRWNGRMGVEAFWKVQKKRIELGCIDAAVS